jgi:hypothetical protein
MRNNLKQRPSDKAVSHKTVTDSSTLDMIRKYLGTVFSYHKGSLLETNLLFVVNDGMQESHCPTGIAVKKTGLKQFDTNYRANNSVYIGS